MVPLFSVVVLQYVELLLLSLTGANTHNSVFCITTGVSMALTAPSALQYAQSPSLFTLLPPPHFTTPAPLPEQPSS